MTTLSETAIQLLRQLSDGRFHSGQQLAQGLAISRTSVWKHIQRLQRLGLEITAVSGKGYRMAVSVELLDKSKIESFLQALSPRFQAPIEIFSSLASTNAYLMETAGDKTAGAVCLAEMQTAGKGRLGRRWVSPYGSNIYLSLLWRFANLQQVSGISLAVGVAVIHALLRLGFPPLNLKWPNDILWQNRKLGGILVEASLESQGQCTVVIGVGLNLSMPKEASADIDQPWVDAQTLLTGPMPSRNEIAATMIHHLVGLLREYESEGLLPWLEDWRTWDCILGKEVVVTQGERRFEAVAEDVSDSGQLRLRLPDGSRCLLAAGDVQLRPKG